MGKISEKMKDGPFGDEKILKKSRTVPKQIDRGLFRIVGFRKCTEKFVRNRDSNPRPLGSPPPIKVCNKKVVHTR